MAVALIVLAVALAGQRTGGTGVAHVSVVQLGADATAILDLEGTLDAGNAASIQSRIDALLPASVDLRIELGCQVNGTSAFGSALPSRRFIAAGKRYLVVSSGGTVADRCVARWWAWNR